MYGNDKGLVWLPVNRPSKLSPDDEFIFYDQIVNHENDNQKYVLELVLAVYDHSTTLWIPFSTFSQRISIGGHSSNDDVKFGTYSVRNLFFPGYGKYLITLRLWNEAHTEVYDEIAFPSIEYSQAITFTLHSPADLYVTDAQGLHVGVDPTTGQPVNEIPGAVYTGPGSEPQAITIPDPLYSNYLVGLIGRATGDYSLTAEFITAQGTRSQTLRGNMPVGEVRYYTSSISTRSIDIGIANLTASQPAINQGRSLNVSIEVTNHGLQTEIFNVTFSANTTCLANYTQIVLESNNSTTLTFTWNTTDFEISNYTIAAYVNFLTGENDSSDNVDSCCIVVSGRCDITGPNGWPDGKVDMMDVGTIARRFQILPNDPLWNSNYDANGDNKIDMVDIGTIARHFGEHYS